MKEERLGKELEVNSSHTLSHMGQTQSAWARSILQVNHLWSSLLHVNVLKFETKST